MPIKMKAGEIAPDHEDASPIGTITETIIDGNKIKGSGIVWPEERPSDIEFLRKKVYEGDAWLSWEIMYEDFDLDDAGVMWLKDPKLLAVTLVKYPAYKGRTPVYEIASDKGADDMPDELIPGDETLEENQESPEDVDETETPEDVSPESGELPAAELQELEELRRFKNEIIAEREKQARLEKVTNEFGEIDNELAEVFTTLNDEQLKAVKKLVSSRKDAKRNQVHSSVTPAVPEIPVPPSRSDSEVLRTYFKSLGGSDGN